MNEVTLLREAGPDGPALTPAARAAARAALLEEIGTSRASRRRPPRRRPALRIGTAVVAVAAAWTAAVLVSGPDAPAPPRPGAGADGVALVDFALPLAPLALPEPPPGTTGPVFGADATGATVLQYAGSGGSPDRLAVHASGSATPLAEGLPEGSVVEGTATVAGRPARVVVMNPEVDDARTVYLEWERTPGQWVLLVGSGRYADVGVLTDLGGRLVDSPQAIPVQLHLAPAGWVLDFLKDDGRVVRLADPGDPERGMTVSLLAEAAPADRVLELVPGAVGPVEEVVVQGQPASLLHVSGGGDQRDWYLQAWLPDGTAFAVQAPGDLTPEQVVQLADGVSRGA
ncbi:hypothetical protein [Blastococcus sp. SYSU D00820]